MPARYEYSYTTGELPATPRKTIEYHYEDSTWGDVLTKITETTYSGTSTASTYSLNGVNNNSFSANALAQSLLGDNYREVDLTANALVNVGATNESNISTYSTNSTTKTLYTMQSDEIGNMTNVSGLEISWNGRRPESISQNGTELISYKYNIDGQRISKTANGVTTEFFYNGDILAGQKKGNDTIVFMYDNNGDIFGFTYNGTPYYYVKNAQNDVFLIIDENGETVVLYLYDSWGRIGGCYDATDFGLAFINPITYRSYYMDLEMGMYMYYLNSRYYMADWGRFVSADGLVQTGQGMLDKNMFAYCGNNPVNISDSTGHIWEWLKDKLNNFVSFVEKIINKETKIETNDVGKVFNKFSTVQDDIREEMYIAAENMINYYNTDKPYVQKTHKIAALNDLIGPQTKCGQKAYKKFNSYINNKLSYFTQSSYGVKMNIQGLSWDELSAQQQQIIAENYLAWSPLTVFHMGRYYGFNAVRDMAQKAYLSNWG